MCKKIGHGTNYKGQPRTLAEQAKVEVELVEEFQPLYFKAFPAHLRWHAHVENTLRTAGTILNLTRRKRQFWGRRDDPATIREAIAYDPQGSLADIVNQGMLGVWRHHSCQLLMQVHDAVVVQYPKEKEDEIIPLIQQQLQYPVPIGRGRELIIPYGCKTGWNFGEYNETTNPEGLRKWKGNDKRRRQKTPGILDRVFCPVHR